MEKEQKLNDFSSEGTILPLEATKRIRKNAIANNALILLLNIYKNHPTSVKTRIRTFKCISFYNTWDKVLDNKTERQINNSKHLSRDTVDSSTND